MSYPVEPTYENYCKLDTHPRAEKVDAYIAGGLRGAYELDGCVYTIVRGSILCEPTTRIRIVYREDSKINNQ